MDAKFTKGEWSIHVHPEVNSIIGIDFGERCETSYSRCDATLYNQDNNANAHLIAAAPDMYKKLKEIADNSFFTPEINKILTKARGES